MMSRLSASTKWTTWLHSTWRRRPSDAVAPAVKVEFHIKIKLEKTALDRCRTDRISPTHDLDLGL